MKFDAATICPNREPILYKKKGEIVISALDEIDRIFLLKCGRVKRPIDGKTFGVGKFLELNSFFGGLNYNYNLIAVTDVQLSVYSREAFLEFIGITKNSKIYELFTLVAKEQIKQLEYNLKQAS